MVKRKPTLPLGCWFGQVGESWYCSLLQGRCRRNGWREGERKKFNYSSLAFVKRSDLRTGVKTSLHIQTPSSFHPQGSVKCYTQPRDLSSLNAYHPEKRVQP